MGIFNRHESAERQRQREQEQDVINRVGQDFDSIFDLASEGFGQPISHHDADGNFFSASQSEKGAQIRFYLGKLDGQVDKVLEIQQKRSRFNHGNCSYDIRVTINGTSQVEAEGSVKLGRLAWELDRNSRNRESIFKVFSALIDRDILREVQVELINRKYGPSGGTDTYRRDQSR